MGALEEGTGWLSRSNLPFKPHCRTWRGGEFATAMSLSDRLEEFDKLVAQQSSGFKSGG